MINIIQKIQVKLWYIDHWIKFKIGIKTYDNIMLFFEECDILFVTEMILNFNSIPLGLHGYGHSNNLLEYLSNNANNNNLISNFLTLFFNDILIISYLDNNIVNFYFDPNEKWQNIKITISTPPPISYLTVDNDLITSDNDLITSDQIQI